mmetsp:Transcript_113110/g.196155  ORF Transcript_113110/g.196155 Transcript_113110/m.196155 type:complete len:643 (+) Transcript_113110:110-2038(+)
MPGAMESSTYECRRQAWPSAQADAMWDCEWGSAGSKSSSHKSSHSAWSGAGWNNKYESSCRPVCHVPAGYVAVALTPGQYRSLISQSFAGCSSLRESQPAQTFTPLRSLVRSATFQPRFAPLAPVDGDKNELQHDKADSAAPSTNDTTASSVEEEDEKPLPNRAVSAGDDTQPLPIGELPSIGSAGHADGSCKRCAFFPKGRCLNGKDCSHCHFDHEMRRRFRKHQKQLQLAQEELSQKALAAGPVLNASRVQQQEPVISAESLAPQISDSASVSSVADAAGLPEESDEELTMSPADTAKEEPTVQSEQQMSLASPSCAEAIRKQDDPAEMETTAPSTPPFSDPDETPASISPTESDSEESDCQADVKPLQASGTSPDALQEPSSSPHPTSWAAQQRLRRAAAPSQSGEVLPAEIARRARALLNKLTEERFESLCGQVLSLPLSTPEQLAAVASEIFEKATTQQFFRKLYTELCLRLDSHLARREGPIGGKSFRKALVSECQASFERHVQPLDATALTGLSEDDRFEAEMKLKNRRLGNMRFIGELFVRRLLALKVMPPILHELLEMNTDAAFESVTALLSVVGPVFDSEKVSPMHRAPVLDAFAVLRRKSTDKAILLRVRCQIRDLLDARARGWTSRACER